MKKNSFVTFMYLLVSLVTNQVLNADDKFLQMIDIKFTSNSGVKTYGINAIDGKRVVIDLGHFSETQEKKEIMVGTVTVTINIKDSENGDSYLEVESVNIEKLESFSLKPFFEITHFIGDGKPNIEVRVENMKVLDFNGNIDNGEGFFGTDTSWYLQYFQYKFDLVLSLENFGWSNMYGFSPKRSEETKAYINIKDIVLDQLRGSSVMK